MCAVAVVITTVIAHADSLRSAMRMCYPVLDSSSSSTAIVGTVPPLSIGSAHRHRAVAAPRTVQAPENHMLHPTTSPGTPPTASDHRDHPALRLVTRKGSVEVHRFIPIISACFESSSRKEPGSVDE